MKTTAAARLLTKTQAAQYCGLGLATFGGTCPVRPIALGVGVRMHRYDVHDIDAWIDGFKVDHAPTTLMARLLDRLDKPSDLDDRLLKVIRYMRDRPECDTAASVRGAGERTMDILIAADYVQALQPANGVRRFELTRKATNELLTIDAWERDMRT